MRLWAGLGMLLCLAACAASPASDVPPGNSVQLTAAEIDLVRLQIEACWKLPAATENAVNPRPEFRVAMNPDGTVSAVDLLNPEPVNDKNFVAAADSAKNALLNPQCQPFKFPTGKYDRWQTFTITFSPDQPKSGSFDGQWSASVGPQGSCGFSSVLTFSVSGSDIQGTATNPFGVFPLTGTVALSGEGKFRIVHYDGTIRFSNNTFEANYANDCGARYARGNKQPAISLNQGGDLSGDGGGQ